MNFERIFNNYCSLLEKHKDQLYGFLFYPEKLNMIKKTLEKTSQTYSYSFSTINLFIPKELLPSHAIPKKFNKIEVVLSIKDDIVINRNENNKVEDPFFKLEKFNILLYCEKKHYTSSWHLDRHVQQENEATPSNLHPIYHFTFGGYHMENLQLDESDEFGRTLILRTPRIMHPPMELILGLDFIFTQFIPKKDLDLLSDPSYIALIIELKTHFWLPFSLAMSKNFCERISLNNIPLLFDDRFVSSVISV